MSSGILIVWFVFNSAFIVFNSTCTNTYSCTFLGGEGWVGGCVGVRGRVCTLSV